LMYSCVTAANYTWLLPTLRLIQHFIGVGCNVAYANMAFINLPEKDQTNYIAFHTLVVNIAGFLGMMLGTSFVAAYPDIVVTVFGLQFTNVQMLLEQVKPQALTKIQSRLVLEAIVAAEGIEATEEEFQSDIKEMAEMYKMDVERALEVLGENGKKQVMEDIAIRKAVDFVVENAKEAKPAAKKSTAKKTKEAKAEEAEATEEA